MKNGLERRFWLINCTFFLQKNAVFGKLYPRMMGNHTANHKSRMHSSPHVSSRLRESLTRTLPYNSVSVLEYELGTTHGMEIPSKRAQRAAMTAGVGCNLRGKTRSQLETKVLLISRYVAPVIFSYPDPERATNRKEKTHETLLEASGSSRGPYGCVSF